MTQPVGSTVGKPEPVGEKSRGERAMDLIAENREQLHRLTMKAIAEQWQPSPPTPLRHRGTAGLRSTEFWLCAFCAALGTLLCFYWPLPEGLAGAMLVGLAAASYAHSRGRVKGRPYVQGKL